MIDVENAEIYHHRMLRSFILFVLLFCSANVLALTHEEVVAGAEKMYRKRMTELMHRFMLDEDAVLLVRLKRIFQTLVQQANHDYPSTAEWRWEIHVSSEPDETAYCMAGGKLLINQNQVRSLNLNDAELAMLLGHEMQHALQQHNLKEYLEAMRLFPAWENRPFSELEHAVDNDAALMQALSALNFNQEGEADTEGLKLAWRAGWRANDLVQFFKKLARASATPNFESNSHPAPGRRWQDARAMAATMPDKKKDVVPSR
jgi:predicted Zn-dependent protease